MPKYCLAIDIGASSGRHIVGWKEKGELRIQEVYRFPNGVRTENGHLVWDAESLVREVRLGIEAAQSKYPDIYSLSVDTWGLDYVLLDNNDKPIYPCYGHRDGRTAQAVKDVHGIIPFSELYRRTGIQNQPFNSIYQLYSDKIAGRLEYASDFLMIPEYLLYRLTGVKSHEYTNATTTGLVNAVTEEYDKDIIRALSLPEELFKPLSKPGKYLGDYNGIRCILCATHDTASAVEGIPMKADQPYLSSGTWSLLGIKSDKPITNAASEKTNWSNEGGVGYIRYQKNIMGLWTINRLRDELCPGKPFSEITDEAAAGDFGETVDSDAAEFLAPESMKSAFYNALSHKPECPADYFRCAYRSLALSYKKAIRELCENTGCTFDSLYIVGGGAKNAFLNRLTEEAIEKKVIALPIEATSLGNLKIQLEAGE